MTLGEEIDGALYDLVDRVSTEGTAKRRIVLALAAALDVAENECDDLAEDPGYGAGWADAFAAVRAAIGVEP